MEEAGVIAWIRDRLATLAEGAERAVVIKGARIVEGVPAGDSRRD